MDEIFGEPALAIYAGDIERLDALVRSDPSIATRTSSVSHPTLLQLVACEANDLPDPVAAARVLVGGGADMSSPLVAAAGCDSRSVLEFLLDQGADIDGDGLWTPLDESLYWANLDIAHRLVDRGARIRALSTAAGLGDGDAIDSFVDGETISLGAGPIASAFRDTVPADLAADAQSIIDHAFVMAVNCGQRDAAAALLDLGAALNARPPGYHWAGTALHAAVWRGDAQLVAWLLSRGADPTIRDGLANADAAGWARHHGHPELVDLLSPR